jgi:hypothetical protein
MKSNTLPAVVTLVYSGDCWKVVFVGREVAIECGYFPVTWYFSPGTLDSILDTPYLITAGKPSSRKVQNGHLIYFIYIRPAATPGLEFRVVNILCIMSIMDPPFETLHQILSHSPKADILALTYTCQHFHSVVEPLLYESITWNGKGPKSRSASPDEQPSKCNLPITFPIHLLLARLLNQPELRKHTKKIMVEGHWPESIWAHRRHEANAVPLVLLTRLAKMGAEVNNGTYTMCLTELHEGHPDLFIILLLSFCPRLQVFLPGLGLHSPGSPLSITRAISKHSALTTLYFPCPSMPGKALRQIVLSVFTCRYKRGC